MAKSGRGRIWRRSDGRWFIYVPKGLAEDTNFPFKETQPVFIEFDISSGVLTVSRIEKRKPVRENSRVR